MAIDEATIKTLAREECGAPDTDEVSASLVDNAMKEACRAVNRRLVNFTKALGTLTMEESVQKYALPSDCLRVIDLFWGPAISTITPTSRIHRTTFDFVATEMGEELRKSRRRKLDKFAYKWDVFEDNGTKYIFLGDVPTSGGKIIRFTYIKDNETSTGIPDGMEEALKEYVKMIIFRTRHAWQNAHEALTEDAELRMTRAEGFRNSAQDSEARFKKILNERLGI